MTILGIKRGVKDPFGHLKTPPSRGTQARASLGGRYNYIVGAEIYTDTRESDLEDLGWRDGGEFQGKSLPAGYWVWVEPYVIVFGAFMEDWSRLSDKLETMEHREEQLRRAVCNHKYRSLRYTIFAPEEKISHGEFLEFGYRKRNEYLGHTKIPEGYWVWVYPHWFIFEEDLSKEETDSMEIAEAFSEELLEKASAGGRFTELIDAFLLPGLGEKYGEYEIMGKGEEEEIGDDLIPAGHRIWCAPYLYVFDCDGKEES